MEHRDSPCRGHSLIVRPEVELAMQGARIGLESALNRSRNSGTCGCPAMTDLRPIRWTAPWQRGLNARLGATCGPVAGIWGCSGREGHGADAQLLDHDRAALQRRHPGPNRTAYIHECNRSRGEGEADRSRALYACVVASAPLPHSGSAPAVPRLHAALARPRSLRTWQRVAAVWSGGEKDKIMAGLGSGAGAA